MFLIFFLNLSLFIHPSWGQFDTERPSYEVAPPPTVNIKPGSNIIGTPVPSASFTPQPVDTTCSKLRLQPGCVCQSEGGTSKIICNCLEVYKKLVYFPNSSIKYNQKRQCLIDFFPGCNPYVLPEGVSEPCVKLKRIVPKLVGIMRTENLPNFCLENFRQKATTDINGLVYLLCTDQQDTIQAQLIFQQIQITN